MRQLAPQLLATALVATLLAQCDEPQDIPVAELDRKCRLIGQLGVPLGEVVTIRGVLVWGNHTKAHSSDPFLRVQSIRGKATQEDIWLALDTANLAGWDPGDEPDDSTCLPVIGATYEMEGYSTGGYVGLPAEVIRQQMIQSYVHHFRESFCALHVKRIPPIHFSPAMFPDSPALLRGRAVTKAGRTLMVGDGWAVVVPVGNNWPNHMEGKEVETFGRYVARPRTPQLFDLVDGTWRLQHLEDQLGQRVELRGKPYSLNGQWWFDYRGTRLYVEGMERLPGWKANNHGTTVLIRGTLTQEKRPILPPSSLGGESRIRMCFVVRDASWGPSPPLRNLEIPLPKEEPIPRRKKSAASASDSIWR